jgi:large conductance mechanosensitive channel
MPGQWNGDQPVLNGFKTFIARGNAVDLATGVVMGAAFTAVTNSLVDSVLNPLIGAVFGKPDFTNLFAFHIGKAEILPGAVLTALVNFLLVALAIYFCVVAPMNIFRKPKAAAPTETDLLGEIRDLLAEKSAGQA